MMEKNCINHITLKIMQRLWIRYGGSNRKMDRHSAKLKQLFPDQFRDAGSIGSGHWSNRSGVVDDTPENREVIKSLSKEGIRIDRNMMKVRDENAKI